MTSITTATKTAFASMSIMGSSAGMLLPQPIFTTARCFLACWIQKMNRIDAAMGKLRKGMAKTAIAEVEAAFLLVA